MKKITITTLVAITICFLGVSRVEAGSLFPSSAPGTSMYSLQELYDLITASTTANIGDGSVINVPSSVEDTMVTMTDLYNAILTLRNASSSDGGGDSGTGSVVEDFSWSVNSPGTIIDFHFTVTAVDEDFTVLASSIASTTVGTATTSVGVLSFSTGGADTVTPGVEYTVLDGDTATFRVRYSLSGQNGTYGEVTITSVAGQEVPDDDQVSPTATINVN